MTGSVFLCTPVSCSLFAAEELYWADQVVPPNPSNIQNAIRFLDPRLELENDAYAVHTTAYALLAHISHDGLKYERDSIMRWLNSMRNYNGGFVSTQVKACHT